MRSFFKARRKSTLAVGVVAAAALAVAGCADRYTGGGGMASALGGPNASFGFQYKLDPNNPAGGGQLSGNYIDRDASGTPVVKMHFAGSQADVCGQSAGVSCDTFINEVCGSDASCQSRFHQTDNCIFSEANYRSTNPAQPGSGDAEIISCDNGKGDPSNNPDSLTISVTSGPFKGYANGGQITNGNLTAHNN